MIQNLCVEKKWITPWSIYRVLTVVLYVLEHLRTFKKYSLLDHLRKIQIFNYQNQNPLVPILDLTLKFTVQLLIFSFKK